MRSRHAGFSILELVVVLAVLGSILAIALPVLANGRQSAMVNVSRSNLQLLSLAHVLYAADWNGRQPTPTPDDLSLFGFSPEQAIDNYNLSNNNAMQLGLILGWGVGQTDSAGLYGYWMAFSGNRFLIQPIDLSGSSGFGWFRLPNTLPLAQYVDGRYYSETFYSPTDTVVYEIVEPEFDSPYGFSQIIGSSDAAWSSYCLSPAANLDADVFAAPSAGGYISPFDDDIAPYGFTSPPLFAAAYPHLKTHMLEHHWLQGAPEPCSPAWMDGTFNGCEPYYFNHGIDSAPVTLFYDGSVRLLPNSEAQASDQIVLDGTGGVDGLWSRDTPYGVGGYFLELSFDSEVDVSHHVLTTDGILGRDTLGPGVNGPRRATSFGPRRGRRAAPERSAAAPGSFDTLISIEP